MKTNINKYSILCHLTNLFLVILLCLILTCYVSNIQVNAQKESIVIDGDTIRLRDGTPIEIDSDYKLKNAELRAVWVSALTGDINGFTTEEQYKKNVMNILDTLQYYNFNAIIFHVRIMNDAFYESKYNDWSSYYNQNPSWDALPWVIEECHKRGIEFHAWMNPYRVTTDVSLSLEETATKYKKTNAASNPNNLLKASKCIILNPGEPSVQDFLIKTCMELATNYDIDAIHFDDYFYAAGIDDSETIRKYNTTGLSTSDWRRLQVDNFIQKLSANLRKMNNETGRRVQLGISPTGVYDNGNGYVYYDNNGKAISTGSNTSAYAHYGSPLYADTLKWINNEWIDYILPQTYWAITNYSGPFCDLTSWWNKVCKNSKTNLYVAMGLYMNMGAGNASWYDNPKEAYYQTMYANSLENVRGISVYQYVSLSSTINNPASFEGMKEIWSHPIIVPEIRTMDPIITQSVTDLRLEEVPSGISTSQEIYNRISFNKNDETKFYVIYRSKNNITYSPNEIIDVIGNIEELGRINYIDEEIDCNNDNTKYYYGVKCLSRSNTLSEGVVIDTNSSKESSITTLGPIEKVTITDNIFANENVMVCWKELYYPLGSKVKYKLIYNFDDNKSVEINTFSSFRSLVSTYIRIPENAKMLNLSIEAYNEQGKTVVNKVLPIISTFNKVTNFESLNDLYSNEEVTFAFNSLRLDNTKYTLQYSYNQLDWIDKESCFDEYSKTRNINITIKSVVPDKIGEINYRIKAQYEDYISYSDVVKYVINGYAGTIQNIVVNNEQNVETTTINEGSNLVIKYDKLDIDSRYIVMYSKDLNNWLTINAYNIKTTNEISDDYITCTVPLNYKLMKFYVKIIASNSIGSSESEVIRVYVKLKYLFSDEVVEYIYNDVNTNILELNIFK